MRRPRTIGQRTKTEARRQQDAARVGAKTWRRWYGLAIWKRIREQQLAIEPLCARCLAKGRAIAATIVNHVEPHRGDWQRFMDGPFESACKPCHDSDIQREERAAAKAEAARREGWVNR